MEAGRSAERWFDRVVAAVFALPPHLAPDSQIELLIVCAQWRLKEANWDAALSILGAAVQRARQTGRRSLLRRCLNLKGATYTHTSDLEQSTICFAEALQIAEQLGDRLGWCATLANLATGRFNSGLLGESIKLNEHVVAQSPKEPHFHEIVAQAHHNIAVASLALSDLPKAAQHIAMAASIAPAPTNPWSTYQSLLFELTHIKVLVALGRSDEALEHAATAKRYADVIGSEAAVLRARLATALCDLSKRPRLALRKIQRLKTEVPRDDPILRDVIAAEIDGYRRCGEMARAAECLKRYLSDRCERQLHDAERDLRILVAATVHGDAKRPKGADESHGAAGIGARAKARRAEWLLERLETLVTIAELREHASGGHARRTAKLSAMLAARLRMNSRSAKRLERAARLHDLGKIAIPDEVIGRGRMGTLERALLANHTRYGSQLITMVADGLSRRDRPWAPAIDILRSAADIARYHHVSWDGSGESEGLTAKSIPLAAAIVAICDRFDELVHDRPESTTADALATIASESGTRFEPTLGTQFAAMIVDLTDRYGPKLERLDLDAKRSSAFDAANAVIARIVESASTVEAPAYSFTRAELDVLKWLRVGRSNREIGRILGKSEFTVKTHVQRMLAKTGLDNRVQLAALESRAVEGD